jgi:uncharacterized protein
LLPGKTEVVEIASNFAVRVFFVASYNHHMKEEKSTYADWKYVDTGKEAVDLFILNHTVKGDIV